MPYLVKADIVTLIYGENIDEITRGDDTIVTRAISAGIGEAKSYLSRFDLPKLFDPTATGYFADENLLNKVKACVAWQLVLLSNPNINLTLIRTNYEDATKWLKEVRGGTADPEGWPYKPDNTATGHVEGSSIEARSNTKRENHF